VACALDLIGDRWTLLVVRDLLQGPRRFKDFEASPEGIPTNILSERLERLLHHDVIEQIPASEGARRMAYQLTEKGRSLRGVLQVLRDWGLKWEPGTQDLLSKPSRKAG
jgi:DNA-binding HxlR family transcriptional regulator